MVNLFVALGMNLTGFEKGLLESEKKIKKFSKNMQKAGDTLTKNVTLPLIGIGAAALYAEDQVGDAMDRIRWGTGATGEALKDLGESFRNVVAKVPADMGDIGQAIADINTRTGLTGKGLEDLAVQMLNLGRVSGEEVSALVASTTRVFGDWSVATDKQAETLDYLFKVSQATGIGVDELANKVVQYGAPMRELGFSFEETTALLGKFEKEGVNAELVMGGMKQGLGKLAKAGKDPREEIFKLEKAIRTAGLTAENKTRAFEIFGARAGIDMAKAMEEGRFDLEALLATLAKSDETINKAADETSGLAEAVLILKNNAMIALEPLGVVLIDLFEDATPFIQMTIEKLEDLSVWFGNLDESTRNNYLMVLGGVLVSGPLLKFIGGLTFALKGVIALFATIGGTGVGSAAFAGAGLSSLLIPLALVAAAWFGLKSAVEQTTGALLDYDHVKGLVDQGVATPGQGKYIEDTKGRGIPMSIQDTQWTGQTLSPAEINAAIQGALPAPGTGVRAWDTDAMNRIRQYATGTDYVPHDGPAYLHRGEAVIPASQNSGGGTQYVQHSGTITVRGVNSRDELVAVIPTVVEQTIKRDDRRIPNRTGLYSMA